jgi:hypothetical protein
MTIYFATFILSQVALFSCFQQETLSAKVVPFLFSFNNRRGDGMESQAGSANN